MNTEQTPKTPEEQYRLAEEYRDRKEFDRALHWYRQAAEQGHPPSCWKIGEAYAQGVGVERNYSVAKEWYIRATIGPVTWERIYAQLSIGVMYENGLGVNQDFEEARKWYMGAYKDCRISEQDLRFLAFDALKRIDGK